MENCLFCKIGNKEIPSNKIYEDELVYAFLDIEPATKGHTLIIPKKHAKNILDINAQTLQHVAKISKHIAKHYKENLQGCKGINIIQSNEKAAQQEVMHYHLHVVPRYKDDNKSIWKHMKNEKIDIDLQEFSNKHKIR